MGTTITPIVRLALAALFFLFVAAAVPVTAAPHDQLARGGSGGWLNVTRPLTSTDMQGRLVLLDFWTYGCINCMQVIPDLEYLEHKFGHKLLIIGVHSAKYTGERGNQRILQAAQRFGLKHPLINDSDYAIWKAYKIKAWPTLVLLGPDGEEVSRFVGEGHRAALEQAITQELPRVSNVTDITPLMAPPTDTGQLSYPGRLAAGADGTLYIADSGHHRIIAVNPAGKILLTIGSGQRGLKDGTYHEARFDLPRGLSVIKDRLYVADTNNHALREIDLKQKTVRTLAGNGNKGKIASPWAIAPLDQGQTLAIAMAGRHQLWSLSLKKQTLSLLAGNGSENIKDGAAAMAELAQPSGLAIDGKTIFFVDAESSSLRVLADGQIKTLVGTGLFDFGFTDGSHPEAQLQHPQGVAVSEDKIYVADTYNDAIRVYDLTTRQLSTLPLPAGALSEPGDVLAHDGKLWIADTNHHAVKIYDPLTKTLRTLALQP